jgi:hypothetical protein
MSRNEGLYRDIRDAMEEGAAEVRKRAEAERRERYFLAALSGVSGKAGWSPDAIVELAGMIADAAMKTEASNG